MYFDHISSLSPAPPVFSSSPYPYNFMSLSVKNNIIQCKETKRPSKTKKKKKPKQSKAHRYGNHFLMANFWAWGLPRVVVDVPDKHWRQQIFLFPAATNCKEHLGKGRTLCLLFILSVETFFSLFTWKIVLIFFLF